MARLRWRFYDVPSTYRETCRAHDEVLNIAVFGFFAGICLAVATLVLSIKRRWPAALACGVPMLALIVLVPLALYVFDHGGNGFGFICDEPPD
jgi:hypothetical protein